MSKVPINAVETSIEVLERLAEEGPQRLVELEEELDYPKTTIYYHLKTLERNGYVVNDGDGYDLDLRILEPGGQVRKRHPLTEIVSPNVKRLAKEANELSVFCVYSSGHAVVLDIVRPIGLDTPVDVDIGSHLPLHSSAVGKAILAGFAESRVGEILETYPLTEHTSETIIEQSELTAQLDRIRSSGHAFERRERRDHVNSVASWVRDRDGAVAGSLGLVGLDSRLYDDRFEHELPHLVKRFAEQIEHDIRSDQ